MDVRLNLKSTVNVIGSVADFAYKWCLNAGLTEEDALRLTLALDELVTDIVLFAYRDEPGDLDISFRRSTSTVEVVIHELGEPFNPDRHQYNRQAALDEGNFEGAGFELVKHLVDDFIFLNKGKGGKEFRITKVIASEHIADLLPEDDLPDQRDLAPPTEYTLALMTEEDAEDVAKLIYRTYGYTYIKEDLYFPKKIEMALEQGDKFAVFVRTTAGEAVGYFAVLFTTNSKIGEVGEAVVSPRHRRRGIMTMMLDALIEESRRRGLLGLFGEAVTVHEISQRVNAKFNMKSTALLLAAFPTARYKDLVESYEQDISIVIDYVPLTDVSETACYLPEVYKDLLVDIYQSLGITARDRGVHAAAFVEESVVDVKISYAFRHALLVVEQYGEDLVERVLETTMGLNDEGIRVIFIDLPLDDPLTKIVVPDLRDCGFVFSGLMPLFHHERDYLRLQMVFGPLDLDQIVLYTDMAKTFRKQIEEDFQWTSKNKALA